LTTPTITNDTQLATAVRQAGDLLQAISDYAGRDSRIKASVRFPRGFIRPAGEQRARLSFVNDAALRANIAYTLLLSDTVYWLLIRTDLAGTAEQMLIKLFLFIGGTMTESITKEYLKSRCGKGYKERTEHLVRAGVISSGLKQDLDWLWDQRNNMHLFLLNTAEYTNDYNRAAHVRCVKAFRDLVDALNQRGRLN